MEKVILTTADASKMRCYVARPKTKAKQAIIVLQEAFGVNSHIQDVAQRFAGEGYLAIAPELFHRTAPEGFTCGYNEFPSVAPYFAGMTESTMQDDVQTCYNWLKQEQGAEKVACIGYCLGGRASFIANAVVPLSCAISYYGGRIAPASLPLAVSQKSPLLFFWGGLDQHIPSEQIQSINTALTEAKKPFTCVQISNADHGFFCNERASYNPIAAKQAWTLTLQFLRDNFS